MPFTRRDVLSKMAFGTALFTTPGLFAEELMRTAQVGEGPFYPDKLPLDTDNDLLLLNDSITPAVGNVTHLTGRVRNVKGDPIRNAFVEIWQVDGNGVYIHSDSSDSEKRDKNFQGYGRFLTSVRGDYYFRTVKPIAYPGRTPHIHIGVSLNGHRIFTSQILVKANKEANQKDGLFKQIKDQKVRDTILCDFKPLKGSKIGELVANFDIILGITAEENADGTVKGVGKPDRVTRRKLR